MVATEKTMTKKQEGSQNEESKPGADKARVQFDFSKESLAKLDELVKTTNAMTRAEVIRKALTLMTEVLDAQERGAKLLLKEPDGTLIQLMPLF
jgi:Arc/MetJ-type ribon-helix-helix transcriptional regulator